ncbi:cytochrome P450 [Dichotomocladium elegans]|nr:cytochrome P450 [Dichotomocladium elegans]
MDLLPEDALSAIHRETHSGGSSGFLSVASAITAAALTAYAFYRKYCYQTIPKGLEEIPSPVAAYPYVGHLFSLGPRPFHQLMEWHRELGNVYRLQMGSKTWLVCGDATLAQELLVANANATSGRAYSVLKTQLRAMNGRGLIHANPTKAWRQMRTMSNTLLSGKKKREDRITEALNEHTNQLVISLFNGHNVDPRPHLKKACLMFILITCFGITDLADQVQAALDREHLLTESDWTTYLPGLSILLGKGEIEYKAFLDAERDPLYRELIASSQSDSVIRSLIDMKEVMGQQMDDKDILVAAADLVEAGTETVMAALLWAFAILSTHKDCQYQIVEEIAAFASEHQRLPTFEDRAMLPFLASTQKELMRFRSVTPLGEYHATEQEVTWRGHVIPQGTTLVTNMYAIHADPNIYKNPDEFIPDRFMDLPDTMAGLSNAPVGQRDQFNFGWGRRVCPGAQLAEELMFNVFVRVFTNCTIEQAVDEDGRQIDIDIDDIVSNGRVVTPKEYLVRFIRHEDSLGEYEEEEDDEDDDDYDGYDEDEREESEEEEEEEEDDDEGPY